MMLREYKKELNDLFYSETKKYQKKYGFKIGTGKYDTWDNEADAFKHTYGSAYMALYGSNLKSLAIGWGHELEQKNNPAGEKNMDLWNNNQGREIAKEIKKQCTFWKYADKESLNDLIAAKVMQRMRQGKLITTPNDKRKFTGFAANIEEDDDEMPKTKEEWLERALNPPKKKYYNIIDDRTFSWNKNASTYMAEHYPEMNEYKRLSDYYNADGHWVTINGNHVYIED